MAHEEPSIAQDVTPELLARYDRPGPRYTSYPTAPVWRDDFGAARYRAALEQAATRPNAPLSLYVHIPFCRERCAFCGCNVIIGRKAGLAETYLEYVAKELALVAEALGDRRTLAQLHWGGGTPTFLKVDELRRLHGIIANHFEFASDAEVALEADPRVTTPEQVAVLRDLGFNRISLGVQDLNADVQTAIGRDQSEEETRALLDSARSAGFEGINVDLIYGLPEQTRETWHETLVKIAGLRPDRLAVYSFALLPEKLRNQKHIDPKDVPTAETKYHLIADARRVFREAGYEAIGMDHFALPEDELAQAKRARCLHRNFMGYTTVPAEDMIGVGTSAIGEVAGVYAQNEKKLSRYYEALDEGRFPVMCGVELSEDDLIRNWVIRQLMCNFQIEYAVFTERFGHDFETYFADPLSALKPLEDDGFLVREEESITVVNMGEVFVRNIAMAFDAYLAEMTQRVQFSRTV